MHSLSSFILYLLVGLTISQSRSRNLNGTIQKRIIEGHYAKLEEFPYVAALTTETNDGFTISCTGSLITSKFVLTAAHCLYKTTQATVALGVRSFHNLSLSTYLIKSNKLSVHEGFIQPNQNDIGVVELSKKVEFTDIVAAIRLPMKSDINLDYDGLHAVGCGFGRTTISKCNFSDHLKYLNVIISKKNINDSTKFCGVGENNGCFYKGDSGGPLVIENSNSNAKRVQIGIISMFYCYKAKYTNSFIKVASYIDWIEQHSDYRSKQTRSNMKI